MEYESESSDEISEFKNESESSDEPEPTQKHKLLSEYPFRIRKSNRKSKGIPGPIGTRGFRGPIGIKGPTGPQGERGPVGIIGKGCGHSIISGRFNTNFPGDSITDKYNLYQVTRINLTEYNVEYSDEFSNIPSPFITNEVNNQTNDIINHNIHSITTKGFVIKYISNSIPETIHFMVISIM